MERAAQQRTCTQYCVLVDTGKISVSDKTRVPTAASIKLIQNLTAGRRFLQQPKESPKKKNKDEGR